MFKTLLIFSVTFTVFLLFLGSIVTYFMEPFISEELTGLFKDVTAINPDLRPVDVIAGTLLSYFVVTALFVVLLRISKELKERGDIYSLDRAIMEGLLFGITSLLIGGILRLLGAGEISNVVVPLSILVYEGRNNLYSAAFISIAFAVITFLAYNLILIYRPPADLITPLYYVFLITLPPFLVWMTRRLQP